MLILTTLTTLTTLASTPTPSIPPHDGGGAFQPFPISTTLTYYGIGGWPGDTTMCLMPLGNSTIYADVCTEILYPAIAVHAVPDNDCTLTVFEGTATCGGDTGGQEVHVIPAGDGGAGCARDQQPAAGERGEAGSGSSTPERPQQAGPTDDVDGAESEVEVDGQRKADGKKGGASKGVEGGSEKKAADAEAEAEVDRQRPGWLEAAQSMSAPWYPYT
ncbi:hypothetical protein B0A55_08868 [Friedmanniomyces simplex]|uniref:Ubiquitin 3 binding protein But2 C-terminal domain-containing protein n=1 Tax=Friedmanniomyces simplex TaxID=329884 RepID=A0A4U0X0L4_9PEZI|nr:hypothetical protein B0A55_08868 [Friedmanniomyces simplex]